MQKQKFFVGDIAYLEVSKDFFAEVKVIAVKQAYGHVRYTIELARGKGQMTIENLYEPDRNRKV